MIKPPFLSIIIPAYRSSGVLEDNLPVLLKWIGEKDYEVEVILVNDGSGDNGATKMVAEVNQLRYIELEQNEGKGSAVRKGMLSASGSIKVFTDADIPFECSALDTIVHYLSELEYDLVIGDRGLEESDYFDRISGKRRFGSGFFTFLVGRFVTTGVSDTQCGLKGFNAEIANDLFSCSRIKGFAFDVELVYIALKRNYDFKKIPVSLRSQDGGSVKVWKHGWRMAWDLLAIKWNHVNGRYRKQK